ncbi:tripartite motif-containing protein 16-like protein isoform X1 [Amphiprion ocellaris]|uniref:B30.2/SPRY domain-containing protein n=1 Tax=Amphiprion ocellaris TaxID=80972 RepID=A0AAQ5X8M5_AMPOC|nr:tripartite motif-containing protein 16-like protein isoform X1 [Amphiprion ocellaris]
MPSGPNSAFIISETSKPGKIIKSNNNEKAKAEKVSVYLPNIPEPTSRAELMQYWMNFTLDDKTANKMLWISDGGSKVCRRTEEVCPVLDRPERYEYSPQVLCKEGIWNMRAYWEVEYSGWVVIGVTYEGAGRRADTGPSGLGENEESWGLCWSGMRYQIWFNGINKDINDVPFCSTVGVYIDQPAGIISFYAVTGEGAEREVKLLHKVKSTIEKKILPGFWMGIQSSCTLLKRAE